MRYLALILGTSLGLGLMSATPTQAVASMNYAGVTTDKSEAVAKSSTQQKAEKVSFWTRLKNFFGGLSKLGWAPFSLIILAILTPPLAVGIASDWDPDKVLIAIILTALCTLPGIIYALIQVSKR